MKLSPHSATWRDDVIRSLGQITLSSLTNGSRLGPVAKSITDWNSATENGWFMGLDAANAPGTGWFMGWVEAHLPTWVTQTVHGFSSDAPTDLKLWRRERNNGTWTGWYRLRWSEAELDAKYGQVGSIGLFAQSTPPTGWLKANGAAVSRTTYAALFNAIQTTWGAGDGSTTFNIPDLRGEFFRAWDDGRGVDSGRSFATAQLDSFQGHGRLVEGGEAGTGGFATIPYTVTAIGTTRNPATNLTLTAYTDGGYGTPRYSTETRPRNVALLACIKY